MNPGKQALQARVDVLKGQVDLLSSQVALLTASAVAIENDNKPMGAVAKAMAEYGRHQRYIARFD